ncbi:MULTISPECIES: hypothetical protein [Mammaliicoccus]|uniref:hypothetical protein n=1 Tax=Mammaliicoccus TaxID=2803850 RepID=UPI001EFAD6C6|nr:MULTISPECIES: hypothetical protein [Mammaliicoccus]WQK74151.1 hypothetical protein P3U33_15225 [Mammaliicoccus sciuri]
MDKKRDFSKLNIIVGQDSYNDKKDVFSTNEIDSDSKSYCFYEKFNTVAFMIKNQTPYKHTFENILNLIYFNKNRSLRKRYTEILRDKQKFIDDMYENNIVFINQNEISDENQHLLLNCNSIITCGVKANKKIKDIFKQSTEYKPKIFYAIHPSPYNISKIRYIDDWIDIKTTGKFKSYHHGVKKNFMIK